VTGNEIEIYGQIPSGGQLDTSSLPGRGTYTVTVTVPSTCQTIVGTLQVR
jgi:hypothetical protein